ncbi:hypothetical protein HK100_006533 [Physocladia obscura]|uniref:arginine--tRNA ligase n=1 Tax=Physocladia obscura TaxID=109957 RepID=A0AAD5SQI1_9FUNG|nr:hypothetical protein HK100_006533 [Physocladia obscura]
MLLNLHKNALNLTFTAKCAAYAEVAAYVLGTAGSEHDRQTPPHKKACELRLGLQRNLHATQAQLIVPAGFRLAGVAPALENSGGERVTLAGKSTALRFISRLVAPALYAALPSVRRAAVDEALDLVRVASTDVTAYSATASAASAHSTIATNKLALLARLTAATPPPANRSAVTLADLAVWDLARSITPPSQLNNSSQPNDAKVDEANAWVAAFEANVPLLRDAAALVDRTLATAYVLDEFRFDIAKELVRVIASPNHNEDVIFPLIENKYPKDGGSGEFVVAVPRLKLPGISADVIAKNLESKFTPDARFTSIKADGVFLKFVYNPAYLRDRLIPRVLSQAETYGQNSSGYGKVSLVEFSSPNIAKPFHVGHLRSTIIGNFIENTLRANGWTTVTINYLGDWGKQYGLLAVGYNKYGHAAKLEADPIRHLFEVYVAINNDASEDASIHDDARNYFARMEEGDPVSLELWQKFVDLSIVKYREIYSRVNVGFDVYSGESKYSAKLMRGVVDRLKELDLLKLDQGAQIVDLNAYKLGGAIIEKSNGGMMYLSRDVAAAIARQKEYKFDNMVYVVGAQQDFHFKQLFKILELMGLPWAEKCQHVNFGMIKSKDGNMSTRKGTVVFLEDILDAVQESMLAVMKKNEAKFAQIVNPTAVADTIGITGIMIQDMGARRNKDYEFNWDRMLAFEGDTGPYLQYAHTRLCSIERKADFEVGPHVNVSVLTEPVAAALVDCIAMYPDVVREAGVQLEPCTIVSYAFRLSHAVSNCVEALYVMNQPQEIAAARLALYKAARITLGNALRALGIVPLERM